MEKWEKVMLKCLNIGGVKFGEYKWKFHDKHPKAPLAPMYTNLRVLRSYPQVIREVVNVLKQFMDNHNLKPDLLADIPIAATPIVSILMEKTGIPMISPRKEEKTRGIPSKIEGVFQPGQTVLLIDDVIALAETKLEVLDLLRGNGLIVKEVLVWLDYELGGREALRKIGVRLYSVFRRRNLLDFYLNNGEIPINEYLRVRDAFEDIGEYFDSLNS